MKIQSIPTKFYTLFIFALCSAAQVLGQNIHIYVSTTGATTGEGSGAGSPVTLTQAKAVARAHPSQACIIYLANGTYSSLSLDATDSRSASAPVVYVSMNPYGAVFQPETGLNRASFQAIPDSIKSRIIDATAKTKVMQLPLSSLGFTDTAQWPAECKIGELIYPRFYKDGMPLPMSRYPALVDSFMPMHKVVNAGVYRSNPGGSFKYWDDRAKYWGKAINDGGLFLSGNWQSQFEMDVVKTLSVSTADSLLTQSIGIYGGLGAQPYGRLTPGQEPYYALNLVEEIAAEGQWAINFRTKMLYMWVPASGNLSGAGNSKSPAIIATNVNNTQFTNLAIRGGSGNGFELHNCNNVQITGNHISFCSGNGVTITGGTSCTVQSNDIDSVGAGGVIIESANFTADQFNVALSKHQVLNNHIYHYATESPLYSGAINVQSAVGTYCAYNKVHDCPHVGILYGGNSNTLEYNDVYDVVKKYSDMGAFYKVEMGQAWLSRGNKLNHNYIHDALAANGIYNDNFASGDSANYNIMERVAEGMFDHQGYSTSYNNNICVNVVYPVTTMVEPVSSPTYAAHYNNLKTIYNASPAYRSAYPEIADMVGSASPNLAYTSRIWPSVNGCVFTANPGIFSNSNIDLLFNKDGTTNATYAQTGPVFTTWNTVFKNNIRLNGARITPILPFTLDSLKNTGAFGLTGAKDWHINRIGLHVDSYRPSITGLTIVGISPVLTLKDSSDNGFKTGGTIYLTGSIKIPNAANVITATYWLDNGKAITGLTISKRSITYDSCVYIAKWTNPPAGTHSIQLNGTDMPFWSYYSNSVGFTITAVAKTETTDSTVQRVSNKLVANPDSVAALNNSNAVLTLFPNPASSQISISYNPATAQDNTNIIIYDLLGRALIRKTTDLQAGPNLINIPLGNLPDGNYLILLQSPHSAIISRRFVIKH